jgi:conjugative transposon TraK protein
MRVSIEKAFQDVRALAILIVLSETGIALTAILVMRAEYQKAMRTIYVMDDNGVSKAHAVSRRDNLPVESRDAVKTFHELFFDLSPDEKAIEDHMTRVYYLSDGSGKKEFDLLNEQGFYKGILDGNVIQEVKMDSIVLDSMREPFHFTYYGTITIKRPSGTFYRNLVTQGYLYLVDRTDNNPHGLLIEHWEVLQNQDLKPKK